MTLVEAAKEASRRAYAPYSGYKVGAALRDERGQVHLGVNVENVSFGATICAERAAVSRMVSEGGRRITELALATRDGGIPCGICLQVLSEFCDDPKSLQISIVDGTGAVSETTLEELMPNAFRSAEVPRT
jgi:cytidine deaminase